MNIDRLSGEYIRGYTKAIMDLQEVFDYVQPDLRWHHKNMNASLSKKLLKCCLENRENLRERNSQGFIRFNKQKQDFEWYENNKNNN